MTSAFRSRCIVFSHSSLRAKQLFGEWSVLWYLYARQQLLNLRSWPFSLSSYSLMSFAKTYRLHLFLFLFSLIFLIYLITCLINHRKAKALLPRIESTPFILLWDDSKFCKLPSARCTILQATSSDKNRRRYLRWSTRRFRSGRQSSLYQVLVYIISVNINQISYFW